MSLWKPIAEYHLRESCSSIMWVASIYVAFITAIMIFTGAIIIRLDDSGNVGFGGAEFVFALTMLIVCASSFKENIQFLLQHGISRWTGFVGFKLHLSIASVIYAVVALLVTAFFSLLQGVSGLSAFIFFAIYEGWLNTVGAVPGFLVHFLWIWSLFFTVGAVGYFITALYNNLNTLGKILVAAGIIIIPSVINRLTNGAVGEIVGSWLYLMFRGSGDVINPLNGIGFFLVLSAIVMVFSWLLVRRYKLSK